MCVPELIPDSEQETRLSAVVGGHVFALASQDDPWGNIFWDCVLAVGARDMFWFMFQVPWLWGGPVQAVAAGRAPWGRVTAPTL